MIVTTFVGLAVLLVGLLVGWPVLTTLSAIFVIVQVLMIVTRAAVERNDRRLSERLGGRRR